MTEHYDDAIVEAGARALIATPGDWPGPEREQEWAEYLIRAVLDAVAPLLAARALEEAAEECEALDWGVGGHSEVWAIRGAWLRDRAARLHEEDV